MAREKYNWTGIEVTVPTLAAAYTCTNWSFESKLVKEVKADHF